MTALSSRLVRAHPAVDVVAASSPRLPLVLSCEHASNHLPGPWSWGEDAWLADTHWAYDAGAAELTLELADALGVAAVLARFTRLLIDANRPTDSPTLLRGVADGRPVALNQRVGAADRAHRVQGWYEPYHDAYDALVASQPGASLFSIHSFTPLYEGTPRAVQVGVLWDADEGDGRRMAALLDDGTWDVRCNEPWSGLEGLMYAAQRHATRHGRRALELEVRDDLLRDPRARARIREALVRVLPEVFG